MENRGLDYTALIISMIGALNWGLIGLFKFNLVSWIFGDMSWISRIIYVIVGILYRKDWQQFQSCIKTKQQSEQNLTAVFLLHTCLTE